MKKLTAFILLLFACQISFAAVPVTFTNGTVADATEVNQNFNYFENKFSTTSGHSHNGVDSKTISTLGTVTTGVWQATVMDEVYGGTGMSGYASGDLIYATSDTGLARLAKGALGSILIFSHTLSEPSWLAAGTSGYFLKSNGAGVNPSWGQLDLASGVTGALPDSNLAQITTASKVSTTALTGYVTANLKVYDSGWFAVNTTTKTYTKTHNLGTTNTLFNLYYATDDSGSNMQKVNWFTDQTEGGGQHGGCLNSITTTTIVAQTGANTVQTHFKTDGSWETYASGYYRIVGLALE